MDPEQKELQVWCVMESVPYTGDFIVSIWATEALAEGELSRLKEVRPPMYAHRYFVEEYTVHTSPKEEGDKVHG